MRRRIEIIVDEVAVAGGWPTDAARLERAIADHLSARLAGRPAPAGGDATARSVGDAIRSAAGAAVSREEGS